MAERDLNSEFTGNVSIFSQTKPRQAVKVDPSDTAHLTTHQPPDTSGLKTVMDTDSALGGVGQRIQGRQSQDMEDNVNPNNSMKPSYKNF